MITVRKIMELDLIQRQLTLIGGKKGLEKQVNFITIMEAPDFHEWVAGGEFVLTSWYAYSQNPKNQEHAFRELATKVSAIAIKVDRFLEKVPDEFIQIANECQTPLFALKRETKFREVIQYVAGEVQNAQANLLVEVEKHYKQLIQEALATDDLSSLLKLTGKRISCSAFCMGSDGKILAQWIHESMTAHQFNNYLENFKKLDRDQELNSKEYHFDHFFVFPCTARKQLLSRLIIISTEELSEKNHIIAQQTTFMLSLKLLEGYETRQKQLQRLLASIETNQITDSHLSSCGINLDTNDYSMTILRGKGKKSFPQLDMAMKQLFSIGSEQVVFQGAQELIFFTPLNPLSTIKPAFIKILTKWIQAQKIPLILVQSYPINQISQLHESLLLIRKVAQAALLMNATGYQSIEDWLVPTLLLNQLHSLEAQQIKLQTLKPIQEYDNKQNADLLITLQAIFDNDKLEQAAEKLHIHINTLRYRLGKIKDLTHYDPLNLKDRFFLWIALTLNTLDKK